MSNIGPLNHRWHPCRPRALELAVGQVVVDDPLDDHQAVALPGHRVVDQLLRELTGRNVRVGRYVLRAGYVPVEDLRVQRRGQIPLALVLLLQLVQLLGGQQQLILGLLI